MIPHLLRRATFGHDPRNYAGLTIDQVVDRLFVAPNEPLPMKAYNNTDYPAPAGDPDLTVPVGQTWVNTVSPNGGIKAARRDSLILFWMEQVFKGDLYDMMTYFWSNHFGVDIDTVVEPNFCYQYYASLRRSALGNFKTLVRDITFDSAMLVRLNGDTNKKGNTNKNFAREIQELFTVGRGNYTEQDIVEASRVFTGMWNSYSTTVRSQIGISVNEHDTGNKAFSSFYGGRVVMGGATEQGAFNEIEAFLNMIFTQQPQNVAKHICRKLYRFFVNSEVDEAFVAQMADVFITNNWEMKPVLRFLFTSQHFYQFPGALVKSPVELVANVISQFKVRFPVNVVNKYWSLNKLRQRLMRMQDMGNPPSIAGWEAYRQVPDFDKVWYNSSSATERDRLLLDLFDQWKFSLNGEGFWVDPVAVANTFTTPSNPNAVVDQVLWVLPFELTAEEKQSVKSINLLNGGTNDLFWTNAWNGYKAGNAANTQTVKDNLTKLFRWVITNEQFQLK